jgi:hypothetical protein
VISYRTVNSGMPKILSSEEPTVCRSNDSPDQAELAISSVMPEHPSSLIKSVPEMSQITSYRSGLVAGSTSFSSSSSRFGSKLTVSKISFVDQSRSKASTGDLTAIKEFFDFSAAAKTNRRSTSSITYIASCEGKLLSKRLCKDKGPKDVPMTSDTESESTALENVDSLIELAGTVEDQGRYEWSRVLLGRVVRLHRQRFGNKHPSTFGALEALSRILRRQGRYSEADQLLVGALKAFLNTGGPKSLESLLCRGLLALAKVDLGQHQQATVLARNSLELARETLGPDDPVLTRTKENLGTVLSFQGHHESAEKIHR